MKKRAGFWIRFLANFLDGLLLLVLYLPFAYFIFDISVSDYFLAEEVNWGSTSLEAIIGLCYFIILPLFIVGATLGKKAVGIQIRKTDGTPLTWSTMLIRELLGKYVLSIISLGVMQIISAFMVGLREDRRSIHDLISKTEVIYPNTSINYAIEEELVQKEDKTSNKAIISLLLGILSLISPLFMFSLLGINTDPDVIYYSYYADSSFIKIASLTPVLMIILAIISMVLYYRAKTDIAQTNAHGLGLAVGGFVCSVLAIFASLFLFLVLILLLPFIGLY